MAGLVIISRSHAPHSGQGKKFMHPKPIQDQWRMLEKLGLAAAYTSLKIHVRDMSQFQTYQARRSHNLIQNPSRPD